MKQRKVSGGQLQAPTIGMPRATVMNRHYNDLRVQMAMGKRVMSTGTSFSIASDGVKIGKPKKETVAYLAANHDKGLAQWLAPQEPHQSRHTAVTHPLGVSQRAVDFEHVLQLSMLQNKGRR